MNVLRRLGVSGLYQRRASQVVNHLFVLWFLVVTIRFCHTILKSMDTGQTTAGDWVWFYGWILAGIVLLLVAIARPSQTFTYQKIPLILAALVISLSGSWLAALSAVWVAAVCAHIGITLLQALTGNVRNWDEMVVCGIPLGIGVLASFIFIIGLCGWLTRPAIVLFLLAITAWGLPRWYAFLKTLVAVSPGENVTDPEATFLYSILATLGTVCLLWAIAPEVQFDALNYHLSVPRTYLEQSAIVEIAFVQAYVARLIELVITACLAIGGPAAAKLWVYLMSACATLAVFTLGRCAFNRRVGLWASVLFATTPLVCWLAGTAYIDNIIALLLTASVIAVIRWVQEHTAGWFFVAALLVGVAIGSKVIAGFGYALMGLLVITHLFRSTAAGRIRTLGIAMLLCGLVALPTYLLTYSFTGNPVFPIFNGIFKSPKWDFTNTIFNATEFGLDPTLASLVRFPFRLTLDTTRFIEALPRGGVGLTLLLAFPFAILLTRGRAVIRNLLIAGVVGYLILLFLTMQYARFYIVVLPMVAVLAVATVVEVTPPFFVRYSRVLLILVATTQPLLYGVQFWNIEERVPLRFGFGMESRDAFLRRALKGYNGAMYLNSVAGANAKILGADTEDLRFYLRPQLETFPIALTGTRVRALADLKPDATLLSALRQCGFSYLFINRAAAKNPPQWLPYLSLTFLQSQLVLEYEDDYALVYRIPK